MKLVIARHCHDGKDGLSEEGREQGKRLGEKLKPYKEGDDAEVTVITSEARRAVETANLISRHMGVYRTPFECDVLGSQRRDASIDDAYCLFAGYEAAGEKLFGKKMVLVLVSHMEIEGLGKMIARRYGLPSPGGLGYGEALVIDTKDKTITRLEQPRES